MDLGNTQLQPIRMLGQGTFGRVFLARCRGSSDDMVCVKRIIVQNPKLELPMVKEEVYIISQLRHPNIIKFLWSYEHAGTINIVMEYAPQGTLRDVITRTTRKYGSAGLNKRQILHYFCDMLLGLEYLHIRHVVHRDIKPENMLIDKNGRIKITDFGISTVHMPTRSHPCQPMLGTPLYMAPEVMCTAKCSFKSDVWSLGCVLYELCLQRNPFTALSVNARTVQELHNIVYKLTRNKLDCQLVLHKYGPIWARVCESMLIYDHKKRIALPDIFGLDPSILFAAYRQYFNYKY